MKRILSLISVLFVAAGVASAQQLVAGAAKVNITPKESDLLRSSDIIRGNL